MRRLLLTLAWIFGILYAVAMVVFLVGWFGLFGVTHDPLAGVFLIPLGLPWNFAADRLPVALQPYASLLAPLINLGILRGLAGLFRRKPAKSR